MSDDKSERISLLGLYYPFYSFTDQLYLIFMTNIFKRLEIRYIQSSIYLAHELDDCQEVLLVDQGYYKIGFLVNNVEHLRLKFGPSTRIGSYNVLHMIRHEFIIKSVKSMFCYSLRTKAL